MNQGISISKKQWNQMKSIRKQYEKIQDRESQLIESFDEGTLESEYFNEPFESILTSYLNYGEYETQIEQLVKDNLSQQYEKKSPRYLGA